LVYVSAIKILVEHLDSHEVEDDTVYLHQEDFEVVSVDACERLEPLEHNQRAVSTENDISK